MIARDDVGRSAASLPLLVASEAWLYRAFLRSAIAVVLTLGAAWGAYLLLRIAAAGSFTAVGVQEVNAHGHAQIFGWVGLFVMGMVCYVVPRWKRTTLAWPGLARLSLWLMVGGLLTRVGLQPWVGRWPWLGTPAMAGSLAEIGAVALIVLVAAATIWRAAKHEASDLFILTALVWFLIQAIYEMVYFGATILAASREELLNLIATWQGPLREIQIHGFAMLMILGASQQLLPERYGTRALGTRRALAGLAAVNFALVGVVVGLILMRQGSHAWAGLWYVSVLLLAAATAMLVVRLGIFGGVDRRDRTLKFIRAAYGWLLISLGMLVALPLYQFVWLPLAAPGSAATEMGFSHAYYGAIRHAITVGFVSLMIVGISASVVPAGRSVSAQDRRGLWTPFLLINAGCALRVAAQSLTDVWPWAFAAAGPSGLLELAGLAVWGVHLWRAMNGDPNPSVRAQDLDESLLSQDGVLSPRRQAGRHEGSASFLVQRCWAAIRLNDRNQKPSEQEPSGTVSIV